MTKIESNEKILSIEETKKTRKEYLDSLKAKCRLQILLGEDPFETYVIIDDQVVGFIQKIFVDVDSENQCNRTIEIAFPKIGCKADVKEYAKNLASLGFVNVVYKNLSTTQAFFVPEKNKSSTRIESSLVEEKTADFNSSDTDFEKSLAMVRGQSEQTS